MKIAIDTETAGFDQNKFHCGVIVNEQYDTELFKTKKELYARIEELEKECVRKGKRLYVYAHNMSFDYVSIGAHEYPENEQYSNKPFIANTWRTIGGKQKNTIKWLCTYGLSGLPLSVVGESIGCEKTPTPQWLYDGKFPLDKQEQYLTEQYCVQDTIVVMKFLHHLKATLEKDGVVVRQLYSTSQISMQSFLKHLLEREEEVDDIKGKYWFDDMRYKRLKTTRYRHKIHQAYRGGRCEAFVTGPIANTIHVDANSLYPYLAVTRDYPALGSEQYIHQPTDNHVNVDWILGQPGVSGAIITTPENDALPYLPVRVKVNGEPSTIYPGGDYQKYTLVGAWTHHELAYAVELGYEIHSIEWSVIHSWGKNPFKGYIDVLYERRKNTTSKFYNHYFKLMMNGCLGKFASNRNKKEYCYVTPRDLREKLLQGWKPIIYYPDGRISLKREQGFDKKGYYAPIWSCYINAYGRTFLYEHMKDIPREKLYYCDTDGILCDTNVSVLEKFKYSKEYGDWKKERINTQAHIWGRKALIQEEHITLNRVPKRSVDKQKMLKGEITYTEPLSVGRGGLQAGNPITTTRNLHEQTEKEEARQAHKKRYYLDTNYPLNEKTLDKLTEAIQ